MKRMADTKTVYGKYRRGDLSPLAQTAVHTWPYALNAPESASLRLALLDIGLKLAAADFVCVARREGRAVGVVMAAGKTRRRPYFFAALSALVKGLPALPQKSSAAALRYYRANSAADRRLLKSRAGGGELSYFAVDKTCRGQGIGRQLYARAVAFLGDKFFLITDDRCDYGFYERAGLRRAAQEYFTVSEYFSEPVCDMLYVSGGAPANLPK